MLGWLRVLMLGAALTPAAGGCGWAHWYARPAVGASVVASTPPSHVGATEAWGHLTGADLHLDLSTGLATPWLDAGLGLRFYFNLPYEGRCPTNVALATEIHCQGRPYSSDIGRIGGLDLLALRVPVWPLPGRFSDRARLRAVATFRVGYFFASNPPPIRGLYPTPEPDTNFMGWGISGGAAAGYWLRPWVAVEFEATVSSFWFPSVPPYGHLLVVDLKLGPVLRI